MLRVTPIYGSRWESGGPAPLGSCTLIEYANVKVLVNAGGPVDDYDWQSLPEHDCLVLTDSTLESMGSLPLYCRSSSSTTDIFATFPTVKMGQMSLYDHHSNLSLDGGCPPYSLEEMDNAFARMKTIKYAQTLLLPTKEKPRLSITAHRAGHVVGGAFYVLQRLQDETCVVITSTYHISKELHLDSSTLLQYGATPDVLVTRPGGPAMPLLSQLYHTKKLKPPLAQRTLVENILGVLRRDGNVLLPVDASGRILELVLLLSQHWERQRLQATYNLVWLGAMVGNTIDFCRSQLEWMAGALGNQFDSPGKGHPYALKFVQFCTSMADLEALLANGNPTCVLANGLSLDHGPARDLLLKWAENDNHAIFFTDSSQCHERAWRKQKRGQSSTGDQPKSQEVSKTFGKTGKAVPKASKGASSGISSVPTPVATSTPAEHQEESQEDADVGTAILEEESSKYTTSYQLLRHWCQAKIEDREMEDSVEIDVLVPRRTPLAGQELKAFLEQEEFARLSKRKLEEEQAMLREVELAKGRLRLGEEQQLQNQSGQIVSQDGSKNKAINPKGLNSSVRPKKKSRFDSSLFLKFSKPLHLTFEVREDAVGVGQKDSTAKFGIGESVGSSEILEDDYGIAVIPEMFVDIVTGVDPSKFAGGSGRIGEDVLRRGFGFGTVDAGADTSKKKRNSDDDMQEASGDMDERGLESADLSEGKGIIRGRNGRPPTKVTTVPRRLQVFAEIDYIPLEGRVDSHTARQSVRALQPRQVVVLGGHRPGAILNEESKADTALLPVDEVRVLAEAAQSFIATNLDVLTPSDFGSVELEVGHAAYSVRLVATPFRTVEEMESEEDPPEAVELHEAKLGPCTVSLIDYVATGQKVALDGSIVLAPRSISSSQPSIYISDGEVLLTDLCAELIAQGMKAEYSAHTGYSRLVVNGKIIVKKDTDTGRVDVEGPLCEDFFMVRSIVCSQYVTL